MRHTIVPTLLATLLLNTCINQTAIAEPNTDLKQEQAKQKMLRQLEKTLGRNTEGPVVYAFYVLSNQAGNSGQPNIQVKVQTAAGRATAAENIFNFMSFGDGWSDATPVAKKGDKNEKNQKAQTVAAPQGLRNFRYLKSFPVGRDAEAEQFATQAEQGLQREIEVAGQRAKAYQEFMRRMQSQMRGGQGNRNGGNRNRTPRRR